MKRTPLRKVSKKMASKLHEYRKLRLAFLQEHKYCQIALDCCTVSATDVHHKMRRGKHINDVTTWMAVCRNCHSYIETHASMAREKGYILT